MHESKLDELIRALESDLDWRLAELAVFRAILSSSDGQENRKRALFRAAWAILYAHYEGFSKYCLDMYVEFICKIEKDHSNMPDSMFVHFIDNKIKNSKSLSSIDLYRFFKNEIPAAKSKPPTPNPIDTQSNLWPNLLASILERLDLPQSIATQHEKKISTLVSRRNDIAHGKMVFISDVATYIEYEQAATNVMYELVFAISEGAETLSGRLNYNI